MPAVRSDAEVRQRIIDALDGDARIDASQIAIDVSHGVVALRGQVASAYEKRIADGLVARIKGVQSIRNEIQAGPGAGRTDAEIAADVTARLSASPIVGRRAVQIQVQNGTVTLSGVVESYAERTAIEDLAWAVSGVLNVIDRTSVIPSVARTDAEIAREVGVDLSHSADLAGQQIAVEVKGGTVTLRGTVQTLEQKWLADEVAWWTAGVRDVINELTIASTHPPPAGPKA